MKPAADAKAPFLILETGTPAAPLRRYGGFDHWIRVSARLAGNEVVTCRVSSGEPLPSQPRWAGVLITGSAAMVTERADWSERSADWLRAAHEHAVPLFGICYGHQLIASAFGGLVDYHPQGREMGTVLIHRHADAITDPLFAGAPERFRAQTTHLQSVLQTPPGAALLARSDHDPHKAFRLGESTWGVQFHPEFSATHMRGYIRARSEALRREGRDPQRLHGEVAPAPHARDLLSRFVRFARGRHR